MDKGWQKKKQEFWILKQEYEIVKSEKKKKIDANQKIFSKAVRRTRLRSSILVHQAT
jgi:hypothetical protein